MPKILTDAQFVTMSTPSTPPTGYGSVFVSGSSLFFRNATGTIFDLAATGSSGGGGYTIIREYTASATWTKPAGMYELLVVCVGAGGGGGSGRVGNPSTNRLGGTGGGGGAIAWVRFLSASLPAQCDITIGVGGPSGSSVGTLASNGNNGTAGTATTFTTGSGAATRTLVSANGGNGGNGGTTGTSVGGIGGSVVGTVPRGPWTLPGADGGPNTAAVVGNPPANNALNGSFGASGGGAAGGINASNVLQIGGSGSSVSYYGTFTGAVAGGIASLGSNGTNGNDNIGKSLLMISGSDTVFGIGSGGGGAGPGGNGGNGGNYGAGGGGGGANTTGSLSGAGGRGGNGLCILIEYY